MSLYGYPSPMRCPVWGTGMLARSPLMDIDPYAYQGRARMPPELSMRMNGVLPSGALLPCIVCTFVLNSVCSYARFQPNSVSVASMTKGHG